MAGLIGFILLVGTAGSLELGNIGIIQFILQSIIGLALLYIQTRKESKYEKKRK